MTQLCNNMFVVMVPEEYQDRVPVLFSPCPNETESVSGYCEMCEIARANGNEVVILLDLG
jgi:hypothetical protein